MGSENHTANILIVEDEPTMAFLLKKLLNDMGYEVCTTVDSGEESLIAAESYNPDLVLMDINLAGEMDGIEAAEIILDKYGIPVIYATADGEEETINQASSTLPLGYILKPYNRKALKSTLVVALSIREVEARKAKELQLAYDTISYQTQELIDSFTSAKEIQRAILPTESGFKNYFPNSFIMNKPKDSLGGDFFWYRELNNGELLFGVVDCTGHGVPGALMSVLVNYQLNQALKGLGFEHKLGDMLSKVDQILSDYEEGSGNDIENKMSLEISDLNSGFDGAFCIFNFQSKKLRFCGAKRPLYIYRNSDLIEIKPNRSSVGLYSIEGKSFEEVEIDLQSNDQLYLFSDGFTDQIGGSKNKRYMSKRFKNKLSEICNKPASEQHHTLNKELKDWQGTIEEQLDDILVLGLKID